MSYHAETDTFSVRPRINWSPKKRGVRKSKDITNMEELQTRASQGLTKRNVASLLMGTLHDPYINNLKLIYRDILAIYQDILATNCFDI